MDEAGATLPNEENVVIAKMVIFVSIFIRALINLSSHRQGDEQLTPTGFDKTASKARFCEG